MSSARASGLELEMSSSKGNGFSFAISRCEGAVESRGKVRAKFFAIPIMYCGTFCGSIRVEVEINFRIRP